MILGVFELNQQSRIVLLFLWQLMVFLCKAPIADAHIPPRGIYYGRKLAEREHSPRIPASFYLPAKELRQRWDQRMDTPSCSQLRAAWQMSIRELSDFFGRDTTNDIPRLTDNPYYLSFLLWKEQRALNSALNAPIYGETINKPLQINRKVAHYANEPKQSTNENKDRQPTSDALLPKSNLDGVFGRIIYSPNDARHHESKHDATKSDSSHHHSNNQGYFGKIVTEIEDDSEDRSKVDETVSTPQTLARPSQNNAHLTADEFFGSTWHDEPIIPNF